MKLQDCYLLLRLHQTITPKLPDNCNMNMLIIFLKKVLCHKTKINSCWIIETSVQTTAKSGEQLWGKDHGIKTLELITIYFLLQADFEKRFPNFILTDLFGFKK